MSLLQASQEIARRLTRIFRPDESGRCPWQGADGGFRQDPECRDLVLFHEYFHAETGRGLGASHQTGWTALVIRLLEDQARRRG